MGLITKEVEVELVGGNIAYYEKLGYKIPRQFEPRNGKYVVVRGTKIMVKTEDLPHGSDADVLLECDNCNKEYNNVYKEYYKHNHDGKTYCKNCAGKILNSGENHYKWNFTLSKEEREKGRVANPEYTQMMRRVKFRDNFTCQCCGKHGGNLEVHHLNGYSWYVEGRCDDNNCITLCSNCHENFHETFGYFQNTKEQFEEWLGKSVILLEKYNGKLPSLRKIFNYEKNEIYESVTDCCEKLNTCKSAIYKCCNRDKSIKNETDKNGNSYTTEYTSQTVKECHLFWLDEYETLSKDEIYEIVYETGNCTSTICITTGVIYRSLRQGAKDCHTSNNYISIACQNPHRSAGKLPDGTKLKWMYYSDFLKLPQEEQNEILSRNESPNDGSFIM